MAILEGKKAIIIGDRDGVRILLHGVFRLNERRRNGSGKPEESKRIR